MNDSRPSPSDTGRVRTQDLLAAVLAGEDQEELLAMLLARARADLRARTALLVLPLGERSWSVELALGDAAGELLGLTLSAETDEPVSGRGPLLCALLALDPDAVEAVTAQAPGADAGDAVLCSPLWVGDGGMGVLALIRDGEEAFTSVQRERADALAALVALALDRPDGEERLHDERLRIARDLHDLAIQELFAAGMELESLRELLRAPSNLGMNPAIARSVDASVQGIERGVAEIRQVVQSLRRERPEATFTERLRHETGLAIAGLGFGPSLRLPPDASVLDREVPEEIAEDAVAVVRECLANAARHAHASAVAIVVSLVDEGVDRVLQVSVSDNGRGIDPSVTRRSGLANMASRARRHAGWVDAIPLEPGTMISWRVTLPAR